MPISFRRFGTCLAWTATIGFTLWLALSIHLFYTVTTPAPPPVDAVIVLGGSSDERLPVAQSLISQTLAAPPDTPVLVLSWTDTPGNASTDTLCNGTPFPQRSLLCFRPEGMDTRSEAAVVGKLTESNGWKSIAVVTSSYHVARAGTLIRQCTDAEINMVGSEPALDSLQWLRRFVIEGAGLIDVNLRPECG